MNKEENKNQLILKHESFLNFILSLTDEDFNSSFQEKWTAGQQLAHIDLSLKPLVKVMFYPGFIIKRMFGTANREGRSYDALVEKYLTKLSAGGSATSPFRPKDIGIDQRNRLIKEIRKSIVRLNKRMNKFSEKDLDYYILPHPLLGKLTLREMMYFTIYHVEHHEAISKRNLLAISN